MATDNFFQDPQRYLVEPPRQAVDRKISTSSSTSTAVSSSHHLQSYHIILDGVPRTQTSRLLLSYYNYTSVEATALLFVQQHVKGAIIVHHVTPPHSRKCPLYRMIVR